MEKLIKILTDPVSNRMIQLIRTRSRMTVSDIISETKDIPRATVYRKIEKMVSAGVIEVTDTHKIRGQTENVYAIKNIFIAPTESNAEGMEIMASAMMQIMGLCSSYFKREDADAERDKLFVLNYAIPLSDSDLSAMLGEIYAVVDKYQTKSTAGQPLRNLYLMSMPSGGEYNEQKK